MYVSSTRASAAGGVSTTGVFEWVPHTLILRSVGIKPHLHLPYKQHISASLCPAEQERTVRAHTVSPRHTNTAHTHSAHVRNFRCKHTELRCRLRKVTRGEDSRQNQTRPLVSHDTQVCCVSLPHHSPGPCPRTVFTSQRGRRKPASSFASEPTDPSSGGHSRSRGVQLWFPSLFDSPPRVLRPPLIPLSIRPHWLWPGGRDRPVHRVCASWTLGPPAVRRQPRA